MKFRPCIGGPDICPVGAAIGDAGIGSVGTLIGGGKTGTPVMGLTGSIVAPEAASDGRLPPAEPGQQRLLHQVDGGLLLRGIADPKLLSLRHYFERNHLALLTPKHPEHLLHLDTARQYRSLFVLLVPL